MQKKKVFTMLILLISLSLFLVGCFDGNGVSEEELIQNANSTLDEFLVAIENSSLSGIETTLSDDFTYTNGVALNKNEFLDFMSFLFIEGASFIKLQLNNRVNEVVSDSKIKISGSLLTEGYGVDGYYFHDSYPSQFTVEKENDDWKITKWIDS